MHGYSFNVGDLLKVGENLGSICSPANVEKQYKDCLRVVFRFWDGLNNVYVVTPEDGITMCLLENDAELQEAAEQQPEPTQEANSRLLDDDTYQALRRLGILDTSVRAYNRGTSDYSRHIIQPWAIWQEYQLNPWDADIVKRILRTKQGDSRRLDYEKIIHICEERIRQIDTED